MMASSEAEPAGPVARVVLQKASAVSLQVDPDADAWVTIADGVLVFVAFLKGATAATVPKARPASSGLA
jgi:hypothetical protein